MLLQLITALQCAQLPKVDSDVIYCTITILFQAPIRGSSPKALVLAFGVGIMTHSGVSAALHHDPDLVMSQWFAGFRGTHCEVFGLR